MYFFEFVLRLKCFKLDTGACQSLFLLQRSHFKHTVAANAKVLKLKSRINALL